MKKKEIEKRLIELEKEAKELRSELEEKPKFEVGKWYKGLEKDFLIYTTTKNNGYGFWKGSWYCDWFWAVEWKQREATKEEVESALIKEAKKRGFKHQATFTALRDTNKHESVDERFYKKSDGRTGGFWDYKNGTLYTCGFGRYVVFEDGKWATIIEPDLIDRTDLIESLEGLEYSGECTQIDDFEFIHGEVEALINYIKNFKA